MTSHPSAPPDAAIAALERRVRWLTAVCVFLGLGFVLVFVRPWIPQSPDLVVRSLTVRDSLGVPRVQLGRFESGAAFVRVNDPSGRTRLGAVVEPDGHPDLHLVGDDGAHRLRLAVPPDGRPVVNLLAPEGLATVSVAARDGRPTAVTLRGRDTLWLAP